MLKIQVTIAEAIDRHIVLGLKLKANSTNDDLKTEWALLGDRIREYRVGIIKDRHILTEIVYCELQLEETHQRLWELEDDVRKMLVNLADVRSGKLTSAREASLCEEITEITKLIVMNNGKRSELKKKINAYCGEPQSEVKIYTGGTDADRKGDNEGADGRSAAGGTEPTKE